MIYNLAKYITTNSSFKIINVNGFSPSSPDSVVSINEGSGDEMPWFDRVDTIVQCVSRAVDKVEARSNAFTIYNLLKKKTRLTLPSVIVSGTLYPSLIGWGFLPNNRPQWAYDDESGRAVFTFSIEVTTT